MSGAPRLGFLYQAGWEDDGFASLIALFEQAEAAGFHSGWVSQHHFARAARRLPSPLVLLSAVAARTNTIHLGTASVILPLEHPLRLAEDVAVLDEISGGRVQLGLGTGFGNAFGEDSIATIRSFTGGDSLPPNTVDDHLERLIRALDGQPIDERSDLRLNPARPGVASRIWRATSTEASAGAAGQLGQGLLLARRAFRTPLATDLAQAGLIDAHAAGAARALPVAASRIVHVTDGALEDDPFVTTVLQRELAKAVAEGAILAGLPLAAQLRHLAVHAGTPPEVAASLRSEVRWSNLTDLLVMVTDAYTPASAAANMRRIGSEVAALL